MKSIELADETTARLEPTFHSVTLKYSQAKRPSSPASISCIGISGQVMRPATESLGHHGQSDGDGRGLVCGVDGDYRWIIQVPA